MMEKINYGLLLLVIFLCFGCSKEDNVMAQVPTPTTETKQAETNAGNVEEKGTNEDTDVKMEMTITIGEDKMTVKLVENSATKALMEALKEAPISYTTNDYGGFEKVGALGKSLPTSDTQITTKAGDVILYNGNQLVLFYGSNSWSYTRLGEMQYQSIDELKAFLRAGQGSINVTLSIK